MPPPAQPPLDDASDALFREMRDRVRQMFDFALSECSIPRAFSKKLQCENGFLRVGEATYDLAGFTRALVISIGKAGHSMAEAFANIVGTGLNGIVACPDLPPAQLFGFRYFAGVTLYRMRTHCGPVTRCSARCRARRRKRWWCI